MKIGIWNVKRCKRFTEEKILCLLNENQDHFKLAQEIEDNMNQFILKYELPENIMKMIEDIIEFIKKSVIDEFRI